MNETDSTSNLVSQFLESVVDTPAKLNAKEEIEIVETEIMKNSENEKEKSSVECGGVDNTLSSEDSLDHDIANRRATVMNDIDGKDSDGDETLNNNHSVSG